MCLMHTIGEPKNSSKSSWLQWHLVTSLMQQNNQFVRGITTVEIYYSLATIKMITECLGLNSAFSLQHQVTMMGGKRDVGLFPYTYVAQLGSSNVLRRTTISSFRKTTFAKPRSWFNVAPAGDLKEVVCEAGKGAKKSHSSLHSPKRKRKPMGI